VSEQTYLERFAELQMRFKASKDQYNAFGKYMYRNVESMLDKAKPIARELGIILLFNDSIVHEGERYFVRATATAYDALDKNTLPLSATAYAREVESKKGADPAQITGMCSSYARKYALSALLAVGSEDDADSMDNREDSTPEEPRTAPETPPAAPVKQMSAPRSFDEFSALRDRLVACGMEPNYAAGVLIGELGDPRMLDEEQYRIAIQNGDVLVRSFEANVNQ